MVMKSSANDVDMRASFAYSDSFYDLPLLRAVGHPVAVNPDPREAENKENRPQMYADGCHLNPPETEVPECIYGNPSSKTTVVLFGDSHAMQWFPALNELAKERETKDPIELLRARLELSDEDFEARDTEITAEVEASVEFAKAGTNPKPEDALKYVYA